MYQKVLMIAVISSLDLVGTTDAGDQIRIIAPHPGSSLHHRRCRTIWCLRNAFNEYGGREVIRKVRSGG